MTREDARAIVVGLRVGGGVLLVLAAWLALGGSLAGRYGFGAVLAVAGLIGAVVLPALIARRYR